MVRRRVEMLLLSAVLAAVGICGDATAHGFDSLGNTPAGLSKQGLVLWNFEGLLHRTFGSRSVPCVPAKSRYGFFDFEGSPCSPLSGYDPYFYVFAAHTETAFHISARTGSKMDFGNYPAPIRIHGHLIACERAEKTFLVEYRDSINFSIDCVAPLG